MKNLYIADIKSRNINGTSQGHYFSIAENYCDIFKDSCNVFVTGGPVYSKKFRNIFKLRYDTFESSSTLKNKLKIIRNMFDLFYGKRKNDIIVIQSSASATALLGIVLFKSRRCKTYMIQYNTELVSSYIKRLLYTLAKAKIDGIICPSKKIGEIYGLPYCVVPDYIYIGTKAVNNISFENKKYDFSVLGLVCRDKGGIDVAKKFKETNYKILIAGKPENDEIKNEMQNICKDSPNITLKLDYLSEKEYDQSIKESKYCILNYSGAYSEHSSGVVFDILFKSIPIIGRQCKYLNFIKEYNLGILFDDITNFNPNSTMDSHKYQQYLCNISSYREKHKEYISHLKEFLNI